MEAGSRPTILIDEAKRQRWANLIRPRNARRQAGNQGGSESSVRDEPRSWSPCMKLSFNLAAIIALHRQRQLRVDREQLVSSQVKVAQRQLQSIDRKQLLYRLQRVHYWLKKLDKDDQVARARSVCLIVKLGLLDLDQNVRIYGLRILNTLLIETQCHAILLEHRLHYLLIRSLERSNFASTKSGVDEERTLTLRLVSHLIKSIFSNRKTTSFPFIIVSSLVAIMSAEKESLGQPCTLMLCQLANADLKSFLSYYPKALSALLQRLRASSMSVSCTRVVIKTLLSLNNEALLIRDSEIIEELPLLLLQPLIMVQDLDRNVKVSNEEQLERLKLCCEALLTLLTTSSGIFQVCSGGNVSVLRTLVTLLRSQREDLREKMVQLFLDALDDRLGSNNNSDTLQTNKEESYSNRRKNIAKRKIGYELNGGFFVQEGLDILPFPEEFGPNLMDSSRALFLFALLHVGFGEELVQSILDYGIKNEAVQLLSHFLADVSTILPRRINESLLGLQELISEATSSNLSRALVANETLDALTNLITSRLSESDSHSCSPFLKTFLNQSKEKTLVDQSNFINTINTPTKVFSGLVKESGVLTKTRNEWDWQVIEYLSMLWPKQSIDQVSSSDQFYCQIFDFFASEEFAKMELTKGERFAVISTRLCTQLIILNRSGPLLKLLQSIARTLRRLCTDDNLSKDRYFLTSASVYYFLFTSHLVKFEPGRKLIMEAKLPQILINMVTQKTNNYEMYFKLALSNVHPEFESFTITKVLESVESKASAWSLLYLLQYFRLMLRTRSDERSSREALLCLLKLKSFKHWIVSKMAMDVLIEACRQSIHVECLVTLLREHRSNNSCLYEYDLKSELWPCQLLTTNNGFDYLEETQQLNELIQSWKTRHCFDYVIVLEKLLHSEQISNTSRNEDFRRRRRVDANFLPPHILSCLALNNEKGLKVLTEDLYQWLHDVRTCLMEGIDNLPNNDQYLKAKREEKLLVLKSSIWCMANLSLNKVAFKLFRLEECTSSMLKLIQRGPDKDLKSSCYHAICLTASTVHGAIALASMNWMASDRSRSSSSTDVISVNFQLALMGLPLTNTIEDRTNDLAENQAVSPSFEGSVQSRFKRLSSIKRRFKRRTNSVSTNDVIQTQEQQRPSRRWSFGMQNLLQIRRRNNRGSLLSSTVNEEGSVCLSEGNNETLIHNDFTNPKGESCDERGANDEQVFVEEKCMESNQSSLKNNTFEDNEENDNDDEACSEADSNNEDVFESNTPKNNDTSMDFKKLDFTIQASLLSSHKLKVGQNQRRSSLPSSVFSVNQMREVPRSHSMPSLKKSPKSMRPESSQRSSLMQSLMTSFHPNNRRFEQLQRRRRPKSSDEYSNEECITEKSLDSKMLSLPLPKRLMGLCVPFDKEQIFQNEHSFSAHLNKDYTKSSLSWFPSLPLRTTSNLRQWSSNESILIDDKALKWRQQRQFFDDLTLLAHPKQARAARSRLLRLKEIDGRIDANLYFEALVFCGERHYSLSTRRFVHALFDEDELIEVILEEVCVNVVGELDQLV